MKKLKPFKLIVLRISGPLAVILLSGCVTTGGHGEDTDRIQKLENRVGNREKSQALIRKSQLRRQYEARVACDIKAFGREDLTEIERLYQKGAKQWGSAEHKQELKSLIEKYPKANRAGCAMLYLGQMSEGEERVTYFLKAISEHNDCWYGDGVQVGAYARFYLAKCFQGIGKTAEAERLYDDIRKNYPDSINHNGSLLADAIPQRTDENRTR